MPVPVTYYPGRALLLVVEPASASEVRVCTALVALPSSCVPVGTASGQRASVSDGVPLPSSCVATIASAQAIASVSDGVPVECVLATSVPTPQLRPGTTATSTSSQASESSTSSCQCPQPEACHIQ